MLYGAMTASEVIETRSLPGALEEPPSKQRMAWVAVGFATIVAAALRLPFLGHQSLWLDEIYTRNILRESSVSGVWHHIRATESTPPLYYFVGWLLRVRTTEAMRLISALALIAAVPVGYLAFRRLVGSRAALAGALILAVNPLLVSYSTDARSYGLFVLTALLSLWGFSVLLNECSSSPAFAAWAAASVACVWTHYFGIFVVGAEVLVLVIARPQVRILTAGWTAFIGVCLIPLVPLVESQSGSERAEFIAGIPLTRRFSETVRQFTMGPNVPSPWLEGAGLLVFGLAVAAGIVMAMRRYPRRRVLVALTAIAFVTPLVIAILGIEDRFYARNVIAVVPLVVAIAAPALLRLRAVPLAMYLTLATITSLWVATDWRYEQVDWRGALRRAETVDRGAAVVAVTRSSAPVVQTYLDRQPIPPSGLLTQRAWIVVEPIRAAGHRVLGPAPAPDLSGFTTLRTLQMHGFRLVLVGASQPTRITPTEIPGATVFAGSPSR